MWFSFFFALVSVASALEIESLDRSCNYDEVWKISKLEPGETWWAGIEFTALADDDVQITAYLAGYDGEPLRTTSEMFNVESGVTYQIDTPVKLPKDLPEGLFVGRYLISSRTGEVECFERLHIQNDKHDLEIRDAFFTSQNICSSQFGEFLVAVRNRGTDTEETVKVTVEIPSAGIKESKFIDDLRPGKMETIKLDIPSADLKGWFDIHVLVEGDNTLIDGYYVFLGSKQDDSTTAQKELEVEPVQVIETEPIQTTKTTRVSSEPIDEENYEAPSHALTMVIALIVVLIAVNLFFGLKLIFNN